MIWEGEKSSLLWYSLWPSTVDMLASCITSCYFSAGGGRLQRRSSPLCHKAKRWIGYLRKGISPLCTQWIIHCNMYGCHILVLLTFLYVTVQNSFFSPFILSPCLCNYHVPISPCPHSHPQYPEGSAVFLPVQQLQPPISLKQKVWCRILENVKFRLYFT